MQFISHGPSIIAAGWSRLAAAARRAGWARVAADWQAKAEICERCPMRVVRCGISYCGKPFLQKIDREPAMDGCGCPCREKAKTPGEHCPLDRFHGAATVLGREGGEGCTCKWCRGAHQV